MRRLLALTALLWPLAARAGETACWFDAGVLVVPAQVAGVAGDYVLDTGAPHTVMADGYAEAAGFAEPQVAGSVQFSGVTVQAASVTKAKLGARFWWLPTPVAGVIGADLLRGYVLDVRFDPCRVGLWPRAQAPAFQGETRLPLRWVDGRPTADAAVADEARTLAGGFVLATGSDTPVRLRDDLADAPGAKVREELYPYGPLHPRLRTLSFAGDLYQALPSGLIPAAGTTAPGAPIGEIGAPVLARYRLRFDFPADRLLLAHENGPPDRSGGP